MQLAQNAQTVASLQRELLELYVAIEEKASEISACRDNVAHSAAAAAAKNLVTEYENHLDSLSTLLAAKKKKAPVGSTNAHLNLNDVDIERHRADLESVKRSLRAAQLSARQRIDSAQRLELFSDSCDATSIRQRRENERVQTANSDRTASLSKLIKSMDAQVRQSEATMESLLQSSNTLVKTQKEYSATGAAIHSSSKLLNKYARRETTDFVLIMLALCLYFGTCFYIVKQRLWGSAAYASGRSSQ